MQTLNGPLCSFPLPDMFSYTLLSRPNRFDKNAQHIADHHLNPPESSNALVMRAHGVGKERRNREGLKEKRQIVVDVLDRRCWLREAVRV